MKKSVLGLFILSIFFVGMSALAAGAEPADIAVNGDSAQAQVQAQVQKSYQFRARTRLRINSSVDMDVNMDVDAMNVGEQTFDIEITSAAGPVELNMTCEETESQLGVEAGKTIRTQNRFRIREQFAIKLQANISVNAKLGLKMEAAEGAKSQWAYFDEDDQEWIPVTSEYKDGMLVAETDHFSVWTVIESDSAIPFSLTGVVVFGLLSAAAIFLYTKKRLN